MIGDNEVLEPQMFGYDFSLVDAAIGTLVSKLSGLIICCLYRSSTQHYPCLLLWQL